MYCPHCSATVAEGNAFCPTCGAAIGQTRPLPPTSAPTKRRTGLIVALVAIGLTLLVCAVVGGVFALRSFSGRSGGDTVQNSGPTGSSRPVSTSDVDAPDVEETSPMDSPAQDGSAADSDAPESGFATPEEALYDALEEGWVYDLFDGTETTVQYIIGPPNSEFTDIVLIEKRDDNGSWEVVDISPWAPLDSDEPVTAPGDEAIEVLASFLQAIQRDRPDQAQPLCIPPFSEDAASAQYSNGEFASFEFLDTTVNPDRTVDILTKETWAYGTEQWIYQLAPTEAGYRIYNLKIPGE